MPDENATTITEELRGIAGKLSRRRNRIARAQRSFGTLRDAYDAVISDLHSAAGERDTEPSTAPTAA